MTVPKEALDAADGTLLAFLWPWLDAVYAGNTLRSQIRTAAALALRDAAPLIAAAQREADAQLAEQHGATIHACLPTCENPGHSMRFADLLRG